MLPEEAVLIRQEHKPPEHQEREEAENQRREYPPDSSWVEVNERERLCEACSCHTLAHPFEDDGRDEEPRDDEEHVNAHKARLEDAIRESVKKNNRDDCDGAEPVDIRTVFKVSLRLRT